MPVADDGNAEDLQPWTDQGQGNDQPQPRLAGSPLKAFLPRWAEIWPRCPERLP